MGRADGRVQPGQRLDTAFSARAWNRAQDAADLVLGQRQAFVAQGPTYRQPYITAIVQIPEATTAYPHGGVAIKLLASKPDFPNPSGVWPRAAAALAIDYLFGEIAEPRNLVAIGRQDTVAPEPFAVTVEPIAIGQTAVACAVAGVVVAGVRVISSQHRFVSLPTRRANEQLSQLRGRLETSDVGKSILIDARNGFGLVQL